LGGARCGSGIEGRGAEISGSVLAASPATRCFGGADGSEERVAGDAAKKEESAVIIATHAIFGTYGFWLPNDPRGSWSTFVGSWELYKYGPATTVSTRRSLARRPHDQKLRRAAKQSLAHPPVIFNGLQARAVGRGFANAVRDGGFVAYACSILPDHVHLVVGWHSRDINAIVGHLKSAASKQLRAEALLPFQSDGENLDSPWVRGGWSVYLNSPSDVQRAIKYVVDNPVKEGKPQQKWPFVTQVYVMPR
jgi:REP element-mobilizing transposase RayT